MRISKINRINLAEKVNGMIKKTAKTIQLFLDSGSYNGRRKYGKPDNELKQVIDSSANAMMQIVFENEVMRAILTVKPGLLKKYQALQSAVKTGVDALREAEKKPWLKMNATTAKAGGNGQGHAVPQEAGPGAAPADGSGAAKEAK